MHTPLRVAVIGQGRAGRARVRDLTAHRESELVAIVSRRAGSPTVAEVLARPDVDAVVIATENATHASLAEAALQAGKHVLVEFPLAATAAETATLFRKAASRVLHVELIGLLTGRHRSLLACPHLYALDIRFQGGLSGWVAEEARAGRHAVLATSRLHMAWSLLGPLSLQTADLESLDGGYRLTVALRGRGPVTLVEERAAGRTRSMSVAAQDDTGAPIDAEAKPTPPLFAADLDVFLRRVRGEPVQYVSDEQVFHVARLCDEIQRSIG